VAAAAALMKKKSKDMEKTQDSNLNTQTNCVVTP
jgi:hypothetical protein